MMHPASWLALGVLSIAAALSSPSAHAASNFPAFMAQVSGRSTTVAAASDGTLIVTKGAGLVAGGGWTNAGNYGVAPGAVGAVKIGAAGVVSVAGKNVGVEIGGSLAKAAIVGGLVGCVTGGVSGCVLGAATPLATAYLASAGVRANPSTGAFEVADPTVCTVAPCFEYRSINTPTGSPRYSTEAAACRAGDPYVTSPNAEKPGYVAFNGFSNVCRWNDRTGGFFQFALEKTSIPARSPTWYPATEQAVRDALIAAPAPAPMMVPELEKSGVDWNKRWPGFDTGTTDGTMGKPKITGPAYIDSEKATTVNPDGSRTVKQSRTPLTYEDGKVTAGPTVTTETTTNPDGSIRQTTTTTTEPGNEAENPPEAVPSDTALPELPELYERKYPEGMTGIWAARKAELMSSPLMSLKDQLLPTIGAGGACPTWSLPVNVAWVDFGTYNVAPPCWIWDFGKVIIVLSAMFLARALIFGG